MLEGFRRSLGESVEELDGRGKGSVCSPGQWALEENSGRSVREIPLVEFRRIFGRGGKEGREKAYGAPRKKIPIAALLQRGGAWQSSVFLSLTFEVTLKPRRLYQKYRKMVAQSGFRS